jgi:hypothetical protein
MPAVAPLPPLPPSGGTASIEPHAAIQTTGSNRATRPTTTGPLVFALATLKA